MLPVTLVASTFSALWIGERAGDDIRIFTRENPPLVQRISRDSVTVGDDLGYCPSSSRCFVVKL